MTDIQFRRLTEHDCRFLNGDSYCFALREYYCGEGYTAGQVNQDTVNIKRSLMQRRDNPAYQHYFTKSIQNVAKDLLLFLRKKEIEPQIDLIVILPSSRLEDDLEYNDKSERLRDELQLRLSVPVVSDLIRLKTSHLASHQGGERTVDFHYRNYTVNEKYRSLIERKQTVILVDDVITSGAHFEGAKKTLEENGASLTIIGLFWAKAVDRTPSLPFDTL